MKPLSAATIEEMKKKIVEANANEKIPEGSILKFSKSSTGYTTVIYPTVDLYLAAGGGKEHFHVNGIDTTPVHLLNQWKYIYEDMASTHSKTPTINPCFIYNQNHLWDGFKGALLPVTRSVIEELKDLLFPKRSDFKKVREDNPACDTLYQLLNKDRVTSISAHSNGTYLSIVAMYESTCDVAKIPYYAFANAFNSDILDKFLLEEKTFHPNSTLFMNQYDFLNKNLFGKLEDKIHEKFMISVDINAQKILLIALTLRLISPKAREVPVIKVIAMAAAVAIFEELQRKLKGNTEEVFYKWHLIKLKIYMVNDPCYELFDYHHDITDHYSTALERVFYGDLVPVVYTKILEVSYLPDSEGGGNKSWVTNAKGVNKALAANETGVDKALATANDAGGTLKA